MQKHTTTVKEKLLSKKHVRIFKPGDVLLDRYKDGSFGMSNCAFVLYSNGYNLRSGLAEVGVSSGFVYEDGSTIVSIGYFRKEGNMEGEPGYLFVVSPRGERAIEKVNSFVTEILNDTNFPCKGVYIRFLTQEQKDQLLRIGFLPIEQNPWHPQAPQEDETFTSSLVRIGNLILLEGGCLKIKNTPGVIGKEKRGLRYNYNAFGNCQTRMGKEYRLIEGINNAQAIELIRAHFKKLGETGKQIGSTTDDYSGIFDGSLDSIPGVYRYSGYLDEELVSVFVAEKLSEQRVGLYTSISLREGREMGFNALPSYGYITFFARLQELGFEEVLLGGSETLDLDRFKRMKLGAQPDPTCWVVKMRD